MNSDEALDLLLSKLDHVKKAKGGYKASCPLAGHAHGDNDPSLSISIGDTGEIIAYCFSQHGKCYEAVLDAVGLSKADMRVNKDTVDKVKFVGTRTADRKQAKWVAKVTGHERIHAYPEADGTRSHCIGISRKASGKSIGIPYTMDTSGRGGALMHWDGDKYLYNLDQITNSNGESVYIPEGEQDCDTLAGLGRLATTNPFGAEACLNVDYTPLAGKDNVVLFDNDRAGRVRAKKVAATLQPISRSVKVVELPGLDAGGDITDWIEAGHTVEELDTLVNAAPIWQPTEGEPAEKTNQRYSPGGNIFDPPSTPEPTHDDDIDLFPNGLKHTDADNSERLTHLHRDRIRYVAAWRQWFVWNGLKWETDPDAVLVTELAKDVSKRLFYELSKTEITSSNEKERAAATAWARQSANRSRLDAMVKLAKGIPGIITSHIDFDTDHWAMGVGNGWINLETGTFHEPDPAKLMTLHSDVKWNPQATAPTWEQALEQWLPNLEVRRYFQRIVGEASVGAVREHLLVLIYGDGGNGKGTAIGALAKTFGPYFVVPDKSLLVTLKGDRHPTEKAALFRKRLAVAAETDHGARLAEAQVKELTGGDQLQARRMYENPWKFWPTHSLWLQTNELPEVEDMGHGVWRRVRVMDWPAHFLAKDADPELSEKLELELEGILLWIIQGALAWGEEGLSEPEAVTKATNAYKASQDLTEQFFEHEGVKTGKGLFVKAADVNRRWGDWTEQTLGKRRSGQEINRRLKSAGYAHSGGRGPTYKGFAFPNDETGTQR
jgi:putative DNA primase/helicase